MKMNWDYIAGFFDGEGSIYCKEGNQGLIRVAAQVVNTNEEVIKDMLTFIGQGNIQVKHPKAGSNYKIAYSLNLTDHEVVLDFLKNIMKRCIVKREKTIEAIHKINEKKWVIRNKLKDVTKEELYNLYWTKGMTLQAIAKTYDVHVMSLYAKIRELGIPKKSWREARESYLNRVHAQNPPCPRCCSNLTKKDGFKKTKRRYKCGRCSRTFMV